MFNSIQAYAQAMEGKASEAMAVRRDDAHAEAVREKPVEGRGRCVNLKDFKR